VPQEPDFDPIPMLETLAAADVDFVVIGGVAGGAHGSSYPTYDLDIAPAPFGENLARLQAAIRNLNSRAAARYLLGSVRTHHTPHGPLDVFSTSAYHYRELKATSTRIAVRGREIRIASLDHLIAMKEPLGHAKDKLMATEYRVLSDVLRVPRE
jgi:hypothetical protein